ncbi:MAG: S9 family peptidase, partial [Gemmatimonadota bacterium]
MSPPVAATRGRMWAAGILGLLAPLAPAAASAQSPYSVEDILSAPFATDLTAAPVGAAFAWVRYDRGVRNLWVAEGPEYVGRRLTDWSEDDGQDLSQLRFTPDGRQVIFVRGGGPNRSGEIPNPRSDPEPATQMVWVAGLDGTSRPLAEGSAPAIAPDGR